MQICKAAKSEGVRPTKSRVTSVCELGRLIAYVDDVEWESKDNILVLQNGTLDLNTMELREHREADYATRALGYAYDPDASAAYFDYALHGTIPEAAEFMQEYAGYCLTTDTHLETAVWFNGVPGSGKSTLIHGLTTMLGDMAGLLSLAQIERSQFALADIPGKRLIMSTEQPSMFLKSTWVLNAIISGELVPIEQKNKPVYTVAPRAKILFAMNDLPRVSDANNGLFRRVKVINFPALPESAREEELKALISTEGPGILNWALEGLRRLRERGRFDIPDCVRTATDDFKRENDKAALFVDDMCVTFEDAQTQSSQLYNAYRQWCFDNGHKAESSTTMAREWTRLGFTKKRTSTGVFWSGIGLKLV